MAETETLLDCAYVHIRADAQSEWAGTTLAKDRAQKMSNRSGRVNVRVVLPDGRKMWFEDFEVEAVPAARPRGEGEGT
jgi:hypothetical protein